MTTLLHKRNYVTEPKQKKPWHPRRKRKQPEVNLIIILSFIDVTRSRHTTEIKAKAVLNLVTSDTSVSSSGINKLLSHVPGIHDVHPGLQCSRYLICWGSYLTNGRCLPDLQPLTLLYTAFDRNGTCFLYLPLRMVFFNIVYNIARVLALCKSYWSAMNKIFIYARPCVNKMT